MNAPATRRQQLDAASQVDEALGSVPHTDREDKPDAALRRTRLNATYVGAEAVPAAFNAQGHLLLEDSARGAIARDARTRALRDLFGNPRVHDARVQDYARWLRERLHIDGCRSSAQVLAVRKRLDADARKERARIKRLASKRRALGDGAGRSAVHAELTRRRKKLLAFALDSMPGRNDGHGGRPRPVAHVAYVWFEAVADLLQEEVEVVVRATYACLDDVNEFSSRELRNMRALRFRQRRTVS
jgi:hypothetical protein